ncbi:hypothetical protein V498_06524, partial [Pseudogymnoascus sp. VKM F-4517 (FW-2822)]
MHSVLGIIATVGLLVGAAIADVNLSQALAQIPTCTAIALAALLMIPMTIIPIFNATRGFRKHFWDVPPQNLVLLRK